MFWAGKAGLGLVARIRSFGGAAAGEPDACARLLEPASTGTRPASRAAEPPVAPSIALGTVCALIGFDACSAAAAVADRVAGANPVGWLASASAEFAAGFDGRSPQAHSRLASMHVGPRLPAVLPVAASWLVGTGADATSASEPPNAAKKWSAAPSPPVPPASEDGPPEAVMKANSPLRGSHGYCVPPLADSSVTRFWSGPDAEAPAAIRFFPPAVFLDAPAGGAAVAFDPDTVLAEEDI
jgi:hypothetical protein